MDDNKYFKLIWRFNSIVIMLAGLATIGGMLIGGIMIIFELTRQDRYQTAVDVDHGEFEEEEFEFGYMYSMEQNPYVMIPLNSSDGYEGSYSSGKSYSAHNYLFINSETNEKRWLFESNQYLIADFDLLNSGRNETFEESYETVDTYETTELKTHGILYRVIKKDTDGDNLLTENDLITLGLSLPTGENYKEVLGDIDDIIGHKFTGKNSLLVIYQKEETAYAAYIRMSDFSVVSEAQLQKIGL